MAFIDIVLPDMSGVSLIRQLRASGLDKERLRILVVTELTSPNIQEFLDAGANGYIPKQEPSSVFVAALRAVISSPDVVWLSAETARQVLKTDQTVKSYGFTSTEMEVIRHLHLSNPEIAEILNVSVHTVRSHLSNIYDKLNIRTRSEALRFARLLGLLPHL